VSIVRANVPAELERARADADYWSAVLADRPNDEGAKRLLGWARERVARIEQTLRAAGQLEQS
jgi:hypothetical protein